MDTDIFNNLVEYTEMLAEIPGISAYSLPFLKSVTLPQWPWPNQAVIDTGGHILTPEQAAVISTAIRQGQVSNLILLRAGKDEELITALLRLHGFLPVTAWMNMSRAIGEFNVPISKELFNLSFLKAEDEDSLSKWCEVTSEVLFQGKKLPLALFAAGIRNSRIELLLGKIGTVAVGTAMLFRGTLPGLYMFGTRQAFRKQGIAQNMMQTILKHLKAEGADQLVLHSTPEGLQFYKSCGFETHGKTLLFMKIKMNL